MSQEHERTPEEIEQAARPVDPPSAQQALEEAVDKLRWLIAPSED